MLYSELLLLACKKVNLIDNSLMSLSKADKDLYSYAVSDAVSRFNNDRNLNIGQERVLIEFWNSDPLELGFYYPIVRSGQNNLDIIDPKYFSKDTLNFLAIGKDSRLQEIPQRLNLVTSPGHNGGYGQDLWTIVNDVDFEKIGDGRRVVCYTLYDNYGLLRTRMPSSVFCVFDRALPYPWSTAPSEDPRINDNSEFDPLDINVNIPSSHVNYFINLIAYELGMNIKIEDFMLRKLEKSLSDQYKALCSNNVTDRAKQPFKMRDIVRNCVISRAYQ